jgi:DNA-binding MarR family transcriptional regulator
MLTHQEIATIRSFNRQYTTTLGLLNKQVFDTDLSFPESRVLLKISEKDHLSPKEIAGDLNLDASYTSRILKKLAKLNFVKITPSSTDARSKIVSLSKDGIAIVTELDQDSNIQIENLISNLNSDEQNQLYQAFNTINQILF